MLDVGRALQGVSESAGSILQGELLWITSHVDKKQHVTAFGKKRKKYRDNHWNTENVTSRVTGRNWVKNIAFHH